MLGVLNAVRKWFAEKPGRILAALLAILAAAVGAKTTSTRYQKKIDKVVAEKTATEKTAASKGAVAEAAQQEIKNNGRAQEAAKEREGATDAETANQLNKMFP